MTPEWPKFPLCPTDRGDVQHVAEGRGFKEIPERLGSGETRRTDGFPSGGLDGQRRGIALAGLALARWFLSRRNDLGAFLASCAYLVGMLTSVVFGVYPYVLPASTNPEYALTIENAKAADYGLRAGLVWWSIGIALAIGYFVFSYRNFAGKVTAGTDHGGY